MQEIKERKILPEKEEEIKKTSYPWELILLVSSLGIGLVLLLLKIVEVI